MYIYIYIQTLQEETKISYVAGVESDSQIYKMELRSFI